MAIRKIEQGTIIPREDGKLIEEYIGAVNTQTNAFSLARMEAPVGWSEPAQRCDFTEVAIVISGVLEVEGEADRVLVAPSEVCIVDPGTTVRYRNGGEHICHYWSLCIPAFRPDRLQILDGTTGKVT